MAFYRYKFKQGEEVAHKGNLSQKMWIVDFKRAEKKNNKGDVIGTMLMGVLCHWWHENILQSASFHSRELIPWNIVEQGEKAIKDFINF
jgi:uncharacterized protein YodC (DUF2158 family)